MVNGVCVAMMSRRAICTHRVVGRKGSMKMGCKFKIRTKKNKKKKEKRIILIEMQICLYAMKVDGYFSLTDLYLVYPILIAESP